MPYKDPEMRRIKHREYNRRYRIKHREKRNAECRAYHAAHRDEIHKRKLAYNRSHKAQIRAYNVSYYHSHKEQIKEKVRKWQAENPDIVLLYIRKSCAKVRKRKTVDAAFYAKCRAYSRKSYARMNILRGEPYRPRFNRRIPDWATFGGEMDYGSQFLLENLTPSQRAYARELAIERKAQRERSAK